MMYFQFDWRILIRLAIFTTVSRRFYLLLPFTLPVLPEVGERKVGYEHFGQTVYIMVRGYNFHNFEVFSSKQEVHAPN